MNAMHSLLRFTLDLFSDLPAPQVAPKPTAPPAKRARKAPRAPLVPPSSLLPGGFKANRPLAPMDKAQAAPNSVANLVGPQQPAQSLRQAIAPAPFSHPLANRELRLAHAIVGYRFERAKRRTIGFMVGPDGLVVRAPNWTPIYEVEAALQTKADWIMRKLAETRERQTRREDARIVWADGVRLPYLGQSITVALDPSHSFKGVGSVLEAADGDMSDASSSGVLRVALPKHATPEQIRDAVQAWLMRQAKANFIQRLDHFAPLLGVKWQRMGLSNAGTRWGSAKSDGSIRLNWRLIHFRQPVIDYVVAHELSHLRVMDHSPRFWDTVSTVVPDYAMLRGQLKDDSIPKW